MVDFLAFDGRGRPVTDLRAEEIVIRVGGETGDMQSLRVLPAASPPASHIPRVPALPFASAEAEHFERRFLLVIDDESLPQGSEQSTRDVIGGFLRGLDRGDHVGLAIVPHGGVRVPMTMDHVRIARAVAQLSGRATGRESPNDAACRARLVLRSLGGWLAAAETPYGPVTVVFFSGSLYDGGGAIQAPIGTFMACEVQLSDFRQVGLHAARSRGYVYVVQPETFVSLQWSSSPRAGLEQLAGTTGGRILQLSGRDPHLLDRVTSETSAIYVARVVVSGRPQAVQTLTVRTSRSGLTIVARPHIASSEVR